MDCMASNAATKNGLVLSSLPAASGIVVQSPHATTECEFDLANTQIAKTGSNWIATKGLSHSATLFPTMQA